MAPLSLLNLFIFYNQQTIFLKNANCLSNHRTCHLFPLPFFTTLTLFYIVHYPIDVNKKTSGNQGDNDAWVMSWALTMLSLYGAMATPWQQMWLTFPLSQNYIHHNSTYHTCVTTGEIKKWVFIKANDTALNENIKSLQS